MMYANIMEFIEVLKHFLYLKPGFLCRFSVDIGPQNVEIQRKSVSVHLLQYLERSSLWKFFKCFNLTRVFSVFAFVIYFMALRRCSIK